MPLDAVVVGRKVTTDVGGGRTGRGRSYAGYVGADVTGSGDAGSEGIEGGADSALAMGMNGFDDETVGRTLTPPVGGEDALIMALFPVTAKRFCSTTGALSCADFGGKVGARFRFVRFVVKVSTLDASLLMRSNINIVLFSTDCNLPLS